MGSRVMAPPKNLVTAVCVIVAAPVSYAVYQTASILAAFVALVVIGIAIPQLYAAVAVPSSISEED